MTRIARITLASLFAALPLWTFAQEKLDEFNPVQYAIISQTISPDARGFDGDAGMLPQTRMSTRNTGTRQSIRLPSAAPVWH